MSMQADALILLTAVPEPRETEAAKWVLEAAHILRQVAHPSFEADQRDAARYRWLRLNQMASIYKAVVVIAGDGAALSILANGTDLDFAIDNAMSKPRVEVPNSHRHNNGRG